MIVSFYDALYSRFKNSYWSIYECMETSRMVWCTSGWSSLRKFWFCVIAVVADFRLFMRVITSFWMTLINYSGCKLKIFFCGLKVWRPCELPKCLTHLEIGTLNQTYFWLDNHLFRGLYVYDVKGFFFVKAGLIFFQTYSGFKQDLKLFVSQNI